MAKTWKSRLKRLKYFIWDEDSLLSWIVNVILAFILVKFIIYPGIGFLLGTSHPVVAVVSGSMEHKTVHSCADYDYFNNLCVKKDKSEYKLCDATFNEKKDVDFDFYWKACGDWYEKRNISKSQFRDFPLQNGFNTGDIIVLRGEKPEQIKKGDVIVFYASKSYPIIHRVVDKEKKDGEYFFTTKGDHNEDIGGDDSNISEDQVIGKAFFRIPFIGWIKLGAYRLFHLFF